MSNAVPLSPIGAAQSRGFVHHPSPRRKPRTGPPLACAAGSLRHKPITAGMVNPVPERPQVLAAQSLGEELGARGAEMVGIGEMLDSDPFAAIDDLALIALAEILQ